MHFRKLGLTFISIAIVVACLFPGSIFRSKVLFPADLLFYYEPWHSEFTCPTSQPSNWILFDEVLEFYPWREQIKTSLLSGTIPLWDPTAFCGYPFCGLYQNALLYLPDRLMDPLPFPIFVLARALFHILIAGLGTALYLSLFNFSRFACALSGLSFGCSGFMVVWLGHPHIKSAAWLPWILLSIETIFRSTKKGLLLLIVSACMTVTAGHIETTLHVATIAMLYLGLRFLQNLSRPALKVLIASLVAAAVVLFLSAGMSFPFAEYLVRSVAYNVRADGVVVQPYLDPILAVTHVLPKLFGSNAENNYWYPEFNSAETGGGFIGVIPLILALAAITTRPPKKWTWFWATHGIIMLFCAGVVYKIPIIYQLAEKIPGYKMSYNFRLVLPLIFSMTVLAGYALDRIIQKDPSLIKRSIYVAAVVIATILLAPVWRGFVTSPSLVRNSLAPVLASALIPVLFFLGAIVLFNRNLIQSVLFSLMIIVITGAELVHFGAGYNPEFSPELLQVKPVSGNLLTCNNSPCRVLPLSYSYPPHIGYFYGLNDIRGNDALTPLVVEDTVALGDPSIKAPEKLPALRMMWVNESFSRIWDMLNIKYLMFPQAISPGTDHRAFRGTFGSMNLFENINAMPRAYLTSQWVFEPDSQAVLNIMKSKFFNPKISSIISGPDTQKSTTVMPSGTCNFQTYSPHEIVIQTDLPALQLLVLSDTFYPGWNAWVDGKPQPVLQVNNMLRGVLITAGQHAVEFFYRPVSCLLGFFLTCVGCMILFLITTVRIGRTAL